VPPALALTLAILTEVAATLALRSSDGFTRPGPSIVVVVGYGASFVLLSIVLRDLEVGFVYAVWSGVGTALVAAIGMLVLGEAVTALKIASLALIVAGVVGLNLGGG
jgi:small multidrug resistance pump